jgi:hypothetical protein
MKNGLQAQKRLLPGGAGIPLAPATALKARPASVDANHIQVPKKSFLQRNNVIRTAWIVTIAIEVPHHNTGMLGLDDMLSFNGERPRRRFNRYIFSIKYIMFLWRNCFDNIGTRTWGQYHCVKRPCQGEFLADSQAIMISVVMPFCTALHRGPRSRITRLSVKLGPTGTGNFRQFDRDTDLNLK